MIIRPKAISWFYENLPEMQIIEDKYRKIIEKNYLLSGFTVLDTPAIERVETLLSKWADDNEIYWIMRLKAWDKNNFELWLRFDLTVPLARYVAQYEWELDFPFKRQQIGKSWRWERPQKGRFREFYQADIDIIWNKKLSLFADVEIIQTIYNALLELNFWDFVLNINNKKLLYWYLENLWIEKINETISVIDKKDKVKSIIPMLEELSLKEKQINWILDLINLSLEKSNLEIISYFSKINNDLLKEGLEEIKFTYNNLLKFWISEKSIKLNPSISRWLAYYTWLVFETFIVWSESLWSISSWWRYDNLCYKFTKNSYPWVWWSIWLSRLLFVLNDLSLLKIDKKTSTDVLVLNLWEDFLDNCVSLVRKLRKSWINTEIYMDSSVKMAKQIKYADNKKIPYVIIMWEEEIKKGIVQLKTLDLWKQEELKIEEVLERIR